LRRRNDTLWLGVIALVLGACGGASRGPAVRHETGFHPRFVLVNWFGQGHFYVAKAIAEDEGLLRVHYADDTEEWASRDRIRDERVARNDHVTVLLRDSLPAFGAVVDRRRDDRLFVRFDAGGTAWVDLDRVEGVGPVEDPLRRTPTPTAPTAPAPEPTGEQMPEIDPAALAPGATITALWVGRPFDGIILDRRGDLLQVRWDGNGTIGWIGVDLVLEVFLKAVPAQATAGARVRARARDGVASDAVVVARLPTGKIRVRWVRDGTEADVGAADVLRIHARAPVDEIREGAKVRVAWQGDVFSAEVIERRETLVRVRWEVDGGEAWVDAADIREVRTP
jgi:hypothetical protein